MKNKKVTFAFRAKQEGEKKKELFIEGFANRAAIKGVKVVDRGLEHIPSAEWKIDEWLKNPIIFFNHDRSIPIGKGVGAKVTEDGLYIKAQISNSNSPDVQKARDLIEEGILQTFSVGIDVEHEELADDKSITLKGVNLLETSVVSIPMNQESFFSISQKSLESTPLDILESEILAAEGKDFAAKIHKAIHAKMLVDKGFKRNDLLNKEGMREVLAGHKSPTKGIMEELSAILGLDITENGDAEPKAEDNTEKPKPNDENEEEIDENPKSNGENEESNEDEDDGEKELEDEEASEEEEEQGKQELENEKPTAPLETTDQLTEDLGQPALQSLQQLTTMMAQLITLTQDNAKLMNDFMNLQATAEAELNEELIEDDSDEEEIDEEMLLEVDEEENISDNDEDEDASKCLDSIRNYQEKMNTTLAKFSL